MSTIRKAIMNWRAMTILLLAVASVPAWAMSDPYRGPDGARYWYSEGHWYRWGSGRWSEAHAPVGLLVPYLPYYVRMIPYNGTSYYYADQTYYVWNDTKRQFQVTAAPAGINSSAAMRPVAPMAMQAPPEMRVFIYPKNGQSADQQTRDRNECARWAVDQSHFDPAQPGIAASSAQGMQLRDAYYRAQAGCLEARGYTVK